MVKTFVVGILSLFDYELKLLKINAENKYEALKKGMIESCNEKYKQEEINWQNSEEYPKTYKELVDLLFASDTCVNVIEI